VIGKYIFRIDRKHIFNPSAFGIAAVLLFTNDAWLSPGQWGSNALVFFLVVTLGTIVITRVQRLDISLAFLLTYMGLLFARQVLYLDWPFDFFSAFGKHRQSFIVHLFHDQRSKNGT
jgi:Na+-transporting NADH:ubiquinone oxidoreductase subunit NqrB